MFRQIPATITLAIAFFIGAGCIRLTNHFWEHLSPGWASALALGVFLAGVQLALLVGAALFHLWDHIHQSAARRR